MQQFVYPAVFYHDKEENNYLAMIPDLDILIRGNSIEEAMLVAKDYLTAYCYASIKYAEEVVMPSTYEATQQKYNDGIVMLLDAIVDTKKLKLY